jgi:uncharacterized protein (TIGR02996 family)
VTEDAFLRTIEGKPDDDATRLVYADWLEERSDPESLARASFLRADCELAASTPKEQRRPELAVLRRQLAGRLPGDWLAVVSKLPIEKCSFEYECPLKWENLQPVEGSNTRRFCGQCKQSVYFCETLSEARGHARRGHCVAVNAGLTRKKGDLDVVERPMLMGVLIDPGSLDPFGQAEEDQE